MSESLIIPIESLDDPRVAPYLNLKERDLAREGGRFIAEGELVVRRLLDSELKVESLLVATHRLERILLGVRPGVPVYVADAKLVNGILGFKFHSGIMACGIRPPRRPMDEFARCWNDPVTLVVLPEVANTDNMGSLIRISAAFGATAVLVGPRSCDPFYRQSVRVSMGTIFRVPIIQSENLLADLARLRERWNVELIGTICSEDAEPLAGARRPGRVGLLFGNEGQGLSPEQIAACDRKVTIPMMLGTDSLNVSVAAGVVMYHFTQYAQIRTPAR